MDKNIVLHVTEDQADEAHFLIAGMCAVMMEEYGLSKKQLANKVKIQYFAAKQVAAMIKVKGTSDMRSEKDKGDVLSDVAAVMIGLLRSAKELGYPVNDERCFEVYERELKN